MTSRTRFQWPVTVGLIGLAVLLASALLLWLSGLVEPQKALLLSLAAAFLAVVVSYWGRSRDPAAEPDSEAPGRPRPEHDPESSRVELVVDSMADGVLVTDADGQPVTANPAFRELFGLPGEASGQRLLEHVARVELVELVRSALESGRSQRLDLELEGSQQTLAATCSPLPDRSGTVLAVRDISEFLLLGQIRRDLVANISHELKTPLTAIRGFAETLRDGALQDPATARRFTDRILQQCNRLQALLADLLTLSKLERAEAGAGRHLLQLADLVREALDTLTATAKERNIELVPKLKIEGQLLGEPEALSELCLNLIDNAIKYNREGGRVEITLDRAGDHAILEVADTGRGIPEQSLGRIFERFYRVDRGRSRAEGGTGLGLAIAKHAAEIHGGRIEVESELGKGSRFRVYLPRIDGPSATARPPIYSSGSPRRPPALDRSDI